MPARLRSRLTYANVMATIAVFVALGGGAYAAVKLPANSVGSKQLKKHAVTPAKVAAATIKLFKGQKGDKGDTGPQGIQGLQGIQGIQGSIGPSNAYFKIAYGTTTDSAVTATVSVPAGDYAIEGEGVIDSTMYPGSGGCVLYANGTALSGTAANDAYSVHPSSTTLGVATSDQGVAHLTAPGTIANQCTAVTTGAFVPRASVLAIAVGSATP